MTDLDRPIFLVGASRSGTAMVRSILNNDPDVHLVGETHYFDDLRAQLATDGHTPLSTAQRERSESYFRAITHRPYGHGGDPEKSTLDPAVLRAGAEAIGPGSDAYFEAFCRLMARVDGKSRWGEKTPRHVYRLKELLSCYPGAQAICMVRDARAVVASYRDWENQGGFDVEDDPEHQSALEREQRRKEQSYHIVIASLLWRGTVAAALEAQDEFGTGRVRLQRYEDLVRGPEATTRSLYEWLGLSFRPEALDIPLHNSSIASFQAHSGVSSDPMERWRSKLSAAETGVIETCCGSTLPRAGYERLSSHAPLGALSWAALTLPAAAARAALANRSRIPNLPRYVWQRLRLSTRS